MSANTSIQSFVDSRLGQMILPDKTFKAVGDLAKGAFSEISPSDDTATKALLGGGAALMTGVLLPFVAIPALAWDVADVVVQPTLAARDWINSIKRK